MWSPCGDGQMPEHVSPHVVLPEPVRGDLCPAGRLTRLTVGPEPQIDQPVPRLTSSMSRRGVKCACGTKPTIALTRGCFASSCA